MKRLFAFLCVLGLVASANATVLTFTAAEDDPPATFSVSGWDLTNTVNPNYGSNASSDKVFAYLEAGTTPLYYLYDAGTSGWTPDVTVSYSPAESFIAAPFSQINGFNGINPVASGSVPIETTMTAAAGKQVTMYGFTVAHWAPYGVDFIDLPWKVVDGSNTTLASGTVSLNDAALSQNVTIDPSVAKGDTLKLVVDFTGYSNPDWAYIGNIEFGQTPEPATMALLGLGALGLIRRKK